MWGHACMSACGVYSAEKSKRRQREKKVKNKKLLMHLNETEAQTAAIKSIKETAGAVLLINNYLSLLVSFY